MVTVCQTCGGDGGSVALIYCYNCEELAVHRYCLEVLPETFEEYVVWFCDDCKPPGFKQYSIPHPCPPLPEGNDSRDLISVTSASPIESGSQHLKTTKLSRPSERYKSKGMKKRRRRTVRTRKGQTGSNEGNSSSRSRDETDDPDSNQLPQASCSENNVGSQTGNERASDVGDEKANFEEAESGKTLAPLPVLDSSKTPMNVDYVPAQPIIDPIWKGSLQVSHQRVGYSCRIVAHLSQLACSRVSEEAMLFPEVLFAEPHQRSTVWPKGFDASGARDDNIALYFFAENKSDEKVFKSLISEMIKTDLALRVVVTHAELLVFSSTKLPLRLWRFQGQLYLWGVFRKKQDSLATPESSVSSAEKSPSKVS